MPRPVRGPPAGRARRSSVISPRPARVRHLPRMAPDTTAGSPLGPAAGGRGGVGEGRRRCRVVRPPPRPAAPVYPGRSAALAPVAAALLGPCGRSPSVARQPASQCLAPMIGPVPASPTRRAVRSAAAAAAAPGRTRPTPRPSSPEPAAAGRRAHRAVARRPGRPHRPAVPRCGARARDRPRPGRRRRRQRRRGPVPRRRRRACRRSRAVGWTRSTRCWSAVPAGLPGADDGPGDHDGRAAHGAGQLLPSSAPRARRPSRRRRGRAQAAADAAHRTEGRSTSASARPR